MRDIEYRKATEVDLKGIFDLWWEMHQEHLAYEPVRYGLQPKPECRRICLEKYRARILDPNWLVFVAAVDGAPVGMLMGSMGGRPPTLHQFRVLTIDNVAVAEPWRRKGILRRLMDLATAEAVARGATCVDIVCVEVANATAIQAYEKLGFARREVTLSKYVGGNPCP